MMVVNAEVKKNKKENNISLIKRFTRRVQETGVLQKVRSTRFEERAPSPYTKKVRKLKTIAKRKNIDQMIKLGKISVPSKGRR